MRLLCRQGLEFVFVVMGSGFASPTLLRVMKEAASSAEERMCMALLSMRQKRRSPDMLETPEQGMLEQTVAPKL